jgi:SagB-type dehydrogenase family enzyme
MADKIGDRYQQETKYDRHKMTGGGLDWAAQPSPYKKLENPEGIVKLGEPDISGGRPLFEVLQSRRSRRNFTREPIAFQDLTQLAWAAQGATARMQHLLLRTAPSAGALYPVETYLVANRVADFDPGVYHLNIPDWSLEAVRLGDFGTHIANAALGQEIARDCAVTFCFSIVVERSKWKYKQRGYRYMYLDAGHIGQNLSLAAESLGLGCCMIGAIFDDEVNALIGADGKEETAIYLGCVGSVH